jgi:hypothetical protein
MEFTLFTHDRIVVLYRVTVEVNGLVALAIPNDVVGEVCSFTSLSAMPNGRLKRKAPLRRIATKALV